MNASLAKLQLVLLPALLALALDLAWAAGSGLDEAAPPEPVRGSALGLVPPAGGLAIGQRAALHAQQRSNPLGLAPGHDGTGLAAGPEALPLDAPGGEVRTMGAGPLARPPPARADRG
jgi:hypothetical protein